jgi:hypothetical protein
MAVQVVRPTDTPEIRWPVPPDPRTEKPTLEDTRLPTRRKSRESRVVRLRWALAWLSLVFGAITAWLWLARQDEQALLRLSAIKALRELAAIRAELERQPELRPASLRLYVEQAEAKQAMLQKQMSALGGEMAIVQAWGTERDALQEAKRDLEWLEPRLRQLDIVQGSKLSDEMKANEASLRPVLDRFSEQFSGQGARFRPGLARSLRSELDRRLREVKLAAAPPAFPMTQFMPPVAKIKRAKVAKIAKTPAKPRSRQPLRPRAKAKAPRARP